MRLPRARRVPIFRGSDTDAKEAYYYHASGVDGMGSAGYIDDVVACYADKNSGWTSAADSTKEFKYYPLQNRRHAVVLNSAGKLLEAVKYLSYGTPIALPAGDYDCDGAWDSGDASVINGYGGGYESRYDAELDGDIDSDDVTHANSIASGYQTLGFGVLSSSAVFNRKGYAGYEHAVELAGTKYHVRHRVLDSELGRWTRRDPLGYVGTMSLYSYVANTPIGAIDPYGLANMSCSACGGQPGGPTGPGPTSPVKPSLDQRCITEVDSYILWTHKVPRCRLVQIGSEIYIVCDPPPDNCEEVARDAGYACCRNGGSPEECVVAATSAMEACRNPKPPASTPPKPRPGTPPRKPDRDVDRIPSVFYDYWCFVDDCGCERQEYATSEVACQALVACLFEGQNYFIQWVTSQCCGREMSELERILCIYGYYLANH